MAGSVGYTGFLGIIVLALDIYAIVKICRSGASTLAIVLWSLLIIFFPVIGFIIWFFCGPREGRVKGPVGRAIGV